MTSLDPSLANRLEPRASAPERRLAAIRYLADAGVPVGVLVAPVIPGLTDHELPAILEAARANGAQFARYILLRLPHGVSEIFSDWLERHAAAQRQKVLSRLREMRGGRLYEAQFGTRMRGEGVLAGQIEQLFRLTCVKLGLPTR
ncbi:MAG: radical SAM protein, partial [Vicinamibacteria bacterium]